MYFLGVPVKKLHQYLILLSVITQFVKRYTVHTLTPSKKDQKDILQTVIENMVRG